MEETFIPLFREALNLPTLQGSSDSDEMITATTQFRKLPQWDSLAFLSLIALIDEHYEVVINTTRFREIQTVGEIFEEIRRQREIKE